MTVNRVVLYFLSPLHCSCRFFVSTGRVWVVPCFQGVLNIKRRLIIGTLIAYGVVAAANIITFPNVALELNTNVRIQTVEAHELAAESVEPEAPQQVHGSVEDIVRTYFKDTPIMIEIARCESQFTQINPNTGLVNRGRVNPSDLGVMQINEYYHNTEAKKMGLDLSTLEDNLAYARHLYEAEGTRPWNASKACWQNNNLLAMR